VTLSNYFQALLFDGVPDAVEEEGCALAATDERAKSATLKEESNSLDVHGIGASACHELDRRATPWASVKVCIHQSFGMTGHVREGAALV